MTEQIVITGSRQAIDPDDVSITVGDRELSGWTQVRISAGIERCPRDFELQVTEPNASAGLVAAPGEECTLYIGKDRVVTGYVNRYGASIQSRGHTVSIAGRGACQDLVDCAADWEGQQIVSASVLEVAQKLGGKFGLSIDGEAGPAVGGVSRVIPFVVILLGETAWEVIERLCKIAGLLAYELADGSLLLRRIAEGSVAASGFQEGVNVIDAAVTFSDDQRFSEYRAYRINFDGLKQLGEGGNLIATVKDGGVGRYRPRIIIAEMGNEVGVQNAQDRAAWEASRRWGRGQAVRITTDSWRDSSGALYEPGTLATVDLPSLRVQGVLWLISEVTYRKGTTGTLCDVVLMPLAAFGVQPTLPPFLTDPRIAQLQVGR